MLDMVTTEAAGDQVLSSLQNKWYNVLTAALGLDANSFQLLETNLPLGNTSKFLWDIFNSIPPETLTRVYSLSGANIFYDDYKAVVMNLVPQDGGRFQKAMGDYLPQWESYKKTLKPTDLTNGLAPVFKAWSEINMPVDQATAAYTAFIQVQNGVVGQAVEEVLNPKNIDPNFGPKFTKTIDDLKMAVPSGVSKSFSFDSSTASSDVSHTWAQGNVGGLYSFFTGGASANFDKLSKKAASSSVSVEGSFQHVLPFQAAPVGWFSSAALNLAYTTKDNTVWTTGVKPDWETTFGPNGNLLRLASSLIVVDGIKATITTEASFSSSEQQEITSSASIRFWPFFSAGGTGGQYTKATFDDKGKMTVHIDMPAGNPSILGVNQIPIGEALGGKS